METRDISERIRIDKSAEPPGMLTITVNYASIESKSYHSVIIVKKHINDLKEGGKGITGLYVLLIRQVEAYVAERMLY